MYNVYIYQMFCSLLKDGNTAWDLAVQEMKHSVVEFFADNVSLYLNGNEGSTLENLL